MKSGIYSITNTVNGKVYVGSAVNLERRWSEHRFALLGNRHDNMHLQRAWNKYGEIAFAFIVLEIVARKMFLIEREQYWISERNAAGQEGYNMCPVAGNCLGRKFSAKTKAKMSESAKRRPPISDETRALISATQKAVSPEVRARIAALHIGKKHTAESIAKMSASKTGTKHTAETKAKLSAITSAMPQAQRDKLAAAQRGRKCGPHSPESIAKMSAAKIGHSVSPETRAKISATLIARGAL